MALRTHLRSSHGWLAVVTMLFAVAWVACDSTVPVEIINQSSEPIVLPNAGGIPERVVIAPGDRTSIRHIEGTQLPLTLERTSGERICVGMLTWSDLKIRNFKVVVTNEGLAVRPSG